MSDPDLSTHAGRQRLAEICDNGTVCSDDELDEVLTGLKQAIALLDERDKIIDGFLAMAASGERLAREWSAKDNVELPSLNWIALARAWAKKAQEAKGAAT